MGVTLPTPDRTAQVNEASTRRVGRSLSAVVLAVSVVACRAPWPPPGSVTHIDAVGVAQPDPGAWPAAPVVAEVLERDPWLSVMGADLPRVALYGDGTIIRWDRQDPNHAPFSTARLTANECSRVMHALGPIDRVAAMKPYYNVVPHPSTDRPLVAITRTSGDESVTVKVRGYEPEELFEGDCSGRGDRLPCPPEFLRLYRLLVGLRPTNSVAWHERFVEVMLWPSGSGYETVAWPDGWPNLTSEWAIQRGDMYSVILPGARKAELRNFMGELGRNRMVLLDGRPWDIAFRPVVPGGAVDADIQKITSAGGAK